MEEAAACRKDCHFNWDEFERELSTAALYLVAEKGICSHEITVADFMEYVLAKKQAMERQELWEITYWGTEEGETEDAPPPAPPEA